VVLVTLSLLLGCSRTVEVPTPLPELLEVGDNQDGGNIVGVQTWMEPASYATTQTLHDTLALWLDGADAQEWMRPDTIVVLPESIGTWLLLVDEGSGVIEAETAEDALKNLIVAHMTGFLAARTDAPAEDANQYAIYSMKADKVAAAYEEVMGGLAAEYGVTLVAGSVILPEPEVVDGHIVPTPGGELRNAAFVFDRDGRVLAGASAEAFPTSAEQVSIAPSALGRLPIIDTPAGKLGVLVGNDAWYPDAWDALVAGGAERVVAPSLTSPRGAWLDAWKGYDGWPAPDDVDPQDFHTLTLAEASAVYGMPARAPEHGIAAAMAVPLRGHMWDQGTDGIIQVVSRRGDTDGPLVDGAVVSNLWLPPRTDRNR